ncbi:permease [Clostridium sp. UBA4548]|uniref:permease n=1 Tax=Clostridium sp. UBA4548 TaxID=1946361 RepID=UPI0025BB27D5|nr:permease [Clostridium sp. UBA4548]
MKILKRYLFFFIILLITVGITLINFNCGKSIVIIAFDSFKQMISVLPPIMLLLGLLDVWVPRETMLKYMGENSGIVGIALAIILGSVAAGPLYAAFPIIAVFTKKGVKFSNVMIFVGAWCTTKIPTLLFELAALGPKYTFTRMFVNLPFIILLGYIIEYLIGDKELKEIYKI